MPESRSPQAWRVLAGVAAGLFLAASQGAGAQQAACGQALTFQVATPTSGFLTCNRGVNIIWSANAVLYDVTAQADDPTAAPSQIESALTVVAPQAGLGTSSLVTFKNSLSAQHVYVLKIAAADLHGSAPAPADGWTDVFATFSTKGNATLAPFVEESRRVFRVVSDTALAPCSSGKQIPILVEDRQGTSVDHPATIQPGSLSGPGGSETPTATCLAVKPDSSGQPGFDPSHLGAAVLTLIRGRFEQDKVNLTLKGVYDIFGQELSIQKTPVAVGTTPADKDSASYFLKAAHEAGPHEAPAYSMDLKIAPVLAAMVWEEFQPTLVGTADVGFGKTDSTNAISIGGGLTRIYLTRIANPGAAEVTAIRLTTLLNIEADKTFKDKHNVVFQPAVQPYLPLLDNGRARRARGAFVDKWARSTPAERAKLNADDFTTAWGFSGQLSMGAEVGRAFGTPTVQTDDKTSSVTVPRHPVARVFSKASATVEYYRISLGVAVTPRYLFATEKVGEVNSVLNDSGLFVPTAQVVSIKGWQVHTETTLSANLDRSGHIAFTVTYKRGPDAPVFAKTDTVQSGLTLKY